MLVSSFLKFVRLFANCTAKINSFRKFSEPFLDKVLCYPSTFLIGLNGMPIEIIAGSVNLETILEKLNKAIKVMERNVFE